MNHLPIDPGADSKFILTASPTSDWALAALTSVVAPGILDVTAMLITLAAKTSPPDVTTSIRNPMSVRRYVGAALVTAAAIILPIGAPLAVAEPEKPPCDKEWLPPHERGICDNDPRVGRFRRPHRAVRLRQQRREGLGHRGPAARARGHHSHRCS